MIKTINADPRELEKFGELAHRWWDPNSEFKPLHDINPLRLNYINRNTPVKDGRWLDVGCGGGLVSEGLASLGGNVTGIDLSEKPLGVAKLHLLESGLKVDYHLSSAEDWATLHPESYDHITCLEMLEHVPDPSSTIRACANLVRPGGQIYFSTLNRTVKSFLLAIIAAEQILKLLPKGTHEYTKFIRPSELAHDCETAGLLVEEVIGMTYNPLTGKHTLGQSADINYILRARKPS